MHDLTGTTGYLKSAESEAINNAKLTERNWFNIVNANSKLVKK